MNNSLEKTTFIQKLISNKMKTICSSIAFKWNLNIGTPTHKLTTKKFQKEENYWRMNWRKKKLFVHWWRTLTHTHTCTRHSDTFITKIIKKKNYLATWIYIEIESLVYSHFHSHPLLICSSMLRVFRSFFYLYFFLFFFALLSYSHSCR